MTTRRACGPWCDGAVDPAVGQTGRALRPAFGGGIRRSPAAALRHPGAAGPGGGGQLPSRRSLGASRWKEIRSKTAVQPSPSGDCAMKPTFTRPAASAPSVK